MSHYQALGNITSSSNNNRSTSFNGSATSNSGAPSKSNSTIKGFPFLKNLNHSHSNSDLTQNNSSNSGGGYFSNNHGSSNENHQTQNQKGSKPNSKSKSKKQDQIHVDNTNSYRSNDHDHYPVQSNSNVSSFDAIFQNRLQETIDERIMIEDWLQKRSNSLQMVWKRRWCVLRDDCLFYYRSNTDTKPLGALHLVEFSDLHFGPDVSRKSKYSIRLSSNGKDSVEHIFHTETPQALDLWIDAIQSHINHALVSSNLGPLDPDPGRDRSIYRRSMSLTNDPFQPSGEQSIIDKVLDRLQLEDPTLSDLNDPSTLIMPAPDHSLSQRPKQTQTKNMYLKLDDTLDGWSPSPSAAVFSSSNTSASTNTSMSIDAHHNSPHQKSTNESSSSSSQRSPIIIRNGNQGVFNVSGSQSSTSSFNDGHSSYSSYSEISQSGNGRGSVQVFEHQGRNSSQQGRGSHGYHSTSSSTSVPQQQQQQQQQQQHLYHTQHAPSSPSAFSHRQNSLSEAGSTANSPLASPRLPLSSSSTSGSIPTGLHPLSTTFPLCPELERTGSSGSVTSVSTISLATSDDTAVESGLKMTPIELDSKLSKESGGGGDNIREANKGLGRNQIHCGKNDLSPLEILDRETKAALATEGKKTKKLWSVYGNPGSTPSGEKSNGSSGKRSNSQTQESNHSMFKNLVLVSMPSKKHSSNNSTATSTTKGFSKSMISLPRASESDPQHNSSHSTSPLDNTHLTIMTDGSSTRARSPSVSVLDEALQSTSREHSQTPPSVENIISSRPRNNADPYSQSILKGYIDLHGWSIPQKKQSKPTNQTPSQKPNSAISAITMDWKSPQRNSKIQPQPLRCVDPELQQNHLYYTQLRTPTKQIGVGGVSRHIIAPDELAMAMAIDQEAEGKRQQEAMESNQRPISFLTSPLALAERNTKHSDKPHPLTITTAFPESTAAVAEAIPKSTGSNTPRSIVSNEDSHSARSNVTTTAAWTLPPSNRADESTTLDSDENRKTYRSSFPSQSKKQEEENEQVQSPGIKSEVIQLDPKDQMEDGGRGRGQGRQQGVNRDPPISLATSTSPPVLPRRSPFRTAPVSSINAALPNTQ
ncbi:hypothetical protein BGZ76_003248 [Entomortierella beljakovae]|nr:hypothetical protein BGZ76_003248 [Entomortierella beljakovae]